MIDNTKECTIYKILNLIITISCHDGWISWDNEHDQRPSSRSDSCYTRCHGRCQGRNLIGNISNTFFLKKEVKFVNELDESWCRRGYKLRRLDSSDSRTHPQDVFPGCFPQIRTSFNHKYTINKFCKWGCICGRPRQVPDADDASSTVGNLPRSGWVAPIVENTPYFILLRASWQGNWK